MGLFDFFCWRQRVDGMWPTVVAGAIGGLGALYLCGKSEIPVQVYSQDERIKERMQALLPPYRVPRLLRQSSMMLILGGLSRSPLPSTASFEREIVSLPDGGSVALDWYHHAEKLEREPTTPIILALHGIAGHGQVNYMQSLCQESESHNIRVVCMNARGAGGSTLTSPCGFHAGKSDDVRAVIHHIRENYPHAPLFAIGFSLGANILGKYLGEAGDQTPLSAAVLLSNPFDLAASSSYLNETWFGRCIDARMATNLKEWMEPHRNALEQVVDLAAMESVKTIRQFDEQYILPVFPEFPTVETYYERSSSLRTFSQIKLPLLILHAKDDIVCPISSVPTPENLPAGTVYPPNVVTCITDVGSHVCWLDSLNVLRRHSWAETVTLRFLTSHLPISENSVIQSFSPAKN